MISERTHGAHMDTRSSRCARVPPAAVAPAPLTAQASPRELDLGAALTVGGNIGAPASLPLVPSYGEQTVEGVARALLGGAS
jgi:hypothetical protein